MIEWEELTEEEKAAVKILSERDFLTFVRTWFQISQGQKFIVNWHHRYLAWIVERIITREITNPIINIPPGAGKTEIMSIFFPLYSYVKALGRKGRIRQMQLSYASSLVNRNSIRCRDLIKSEEWQWCWPCDFGTEQVEEWRVLDTKGKVNFEMVSRSTGGQITGGRGGYIGEDYSGCLNLDDPAKPADMFSSVKRDKINETSVNTVRSRRGDKSKDYPTPVVITMQRLHVQDPVAHALAGKLGLIFELFKIPALIDEDFINSLPDEIRQHCIDDVCHTQQIDGFWSFWPANEDIEQLIQLKEINPYTFASQYQQEPFALGGNAIKAEWFVLYGQDEEITRPHIWDYRFITGDTAQKTNEWNDYSVFCLWGVYGGNVYLIDMIRGKWEAPELRQNFIDFVNESYRYNIEDGRLREAYIEDKASGTGLIQEVSGHLPIHIEPVPRNRDKVIRCKDTESFIKQGRVLLPADKRFTSDVIAEAASFTYDDSHEHDDITDNIFDAVDIAIIDDSQNPFMAYNPK